MATYLTEGLKNDVVGVMKSVITLIALYTSEPSEIGGGTEVSGGEYSRQTANWVAGSSSVTFSVPADTTIRGVGFYTWDGEYVGGADLTEQPFNSQGTFTLNVTLSVV